MTDPSTPVAPLLVDAATIAALLNVSQRHVHRLDALEQVPEPVRLGRSVRWRREEIDAWVAAGCPRRSLWDWRSALAVPRSGEQGS